MILIKELKHSIILDFQKSWKWWAISVIFILTWTSAETIVLYLIRLQIDAGIALANSVSKTALIIVGIFFIVELLIKLTNILLINLLPTHISNIQKQLLKEILYVSVHFHIKNDSSSTSSKIVNIHNTIENFLKLIFYGVLAVSFGFIATVIIISFSSKLLAYYFLVWITAMIIISLIPVGYIVNLSTKHAVNFNKLIWKLNDVLKNYICVKILKRELYEYNKYCADIDNQVNTKRSLEWGLFFVDLGRSIASIIFFGGLIYYSLCLLDEHTITTGEFFFILGSAVIYRRDVWRFCLHLVELYQDMGFIIELNQVRTQALEDSVKNHNNIFVEEVRNLELLEVSFNPDGKKIINNINLKFQRGELVGMIGPSGSGKTTIAKLIVGFLKPDDGQIRINNNSSLIGNYNKNILYIQQEPYLFDRSAKENIIYGSQFNKSRFERAVMDSFCDDFIDTLDVKNLSVGQKQRLLIARALYHDVKLLILDEPTSFIDPVTAKKIVANIIANPKINNLILITHNPALLKLMTRTIVVENGKITGDSKTESIYRNKYYKEFVNV